MKYILLLTGLLLSCFTLYADDSNKNSIRHPDKNVHIYSNMNDANMHQPCVNTIDLTPKSLSMYRKMGCIFSNKFYSHGAILNFEGIKSECVKANGLYQWKVF
ncbi:MAG: hypothetical protein ACC657_01695 [Thiohalomonadales bacterium]